VPAVGDAERVLQIGRILVENALLHTPPQTVVRISSALDGGRATLTVADDGPGIPEDAQRQIFERFYRLDGTRASGSGLGLAIARELAELMGGRIELDSRNSWTLFTLVLSADASVRRRAGFPVETI
jgi:two-component system OmpR family sensor kinase